MVLQASATKPALITILPFAATSQYRCPMPASGSHRSTSESPSARAASQGTVAPGFHRVEVCCACRPNDSANFNAQKPKIAQVSVHGNINKLTKQTKFAFPDVYGPASCDLRARLSSGTSLCSGAASQWNASVEDLAMSMNASHDDHDDWCSPTPTPTS